ncbi:MAG: UDP-N-acetylmuramate--L-alanine ligase [Alphaproteobacteria bacterium]|nr:UDP-N-acetylmuramate--L-alanine ligase [Alphaproteobacteria bacterium]
MRIAPLSIGTIHLIGIGGIGMSGIAEILHSLGHKVQGSDITDNANVQRLKAKGISVFVGHSECHIDGVSVVVPSSDIKADNIEIIAARKKDIPVIPRSEMLAELMRFKPAVAIAGTHGKTTTTSLVATLLSAGRLDPTIINGGIINSLNTNAQIGKGDWMVVEADESDGTFIKIPATIVIVTNIEPEHLDYYGGSFEEVKKSFLQFVKQIPFYGFSVLCLDHPEVRNLLPHITDRRFITYGFDAEAHCRASNVRYKKEALTFDVMFDDGTEQHAFKDIILPMRGDHNVLNSLAAISVALKMKVPERVIREGLQSFAGVKRRFTPVGTYKGATVIDDYAHHPTEVRVVINAAKKITDKRVVAVLQPHRFSRLKNLFDDFAACLSEADHVIILPVYGAGEKSIIGLDNFALAKAASAHTKSPVEAVENEEELAQKIALLCEEGGYILCMGAGSITKIAQDLEHRLKAIAPE